MELAEGFVSGVGVDMVEPPVLLICRDRRPQGSNILADHEAIDPLSGTSVLNGIPVDVTRVDAGATRGPVPA